MNKKMYSFKFSQSGLEEAMELREPGIARILVIAVVSAIAIGVVVNIPMPIVAFKPIAVEAAKEALKLTVSGGAI